MRNFTKTGSDGNPSLCTPTTLYPNQIKWTKFLPLVLGFLFFTAAYANATDVGGYVYCDKNNNGSYNSGEELEVAGLEVKIYNKGTSTLLKTVTTDENGYYNATPIANGTQVDAKVVYNGTTYTVTVTSPTSSAHIKVVCAPTTCTTCTSLNLVTNPTFDSNSNGWTATNGEVITATGGPSALGRYLILNNDNKSGNYSVYQDVAIGGNKQYNYSGVAAKHTQGNNSKIYLEFYNGSTKIGNTAAFFVTVNFNTTAFQSYSFDGYTPANTTKIRIVGYANGTALKLDNQKLTTCNDTPTLSVAKDGDLTCNDTSVKLTATSTPSSGVAYDWTVPNGATDPGNVASFDTGTPGTYSVKVTIPGTGAGCSATKSITVTKTECAPCTTCVSVNLVTNPNFDSNTNSWTATNGELSYGTGGAFGGFLVLNNSDKSGNYYVYQDITLGPNKYYNYTGKAAKHGSGNNAKVYLEFYNGSTKIGTTSEFSVTKNYDGTFQDITPIVGYTPANTTKIRIVGYANGTALKLDSQVLTTCNDTPTISVVNDGKLTCTKTSTTVTATANPNSGVTYTWTVPNGATNPGNVASFSATVAGVYKVKVTIPGTGNGCSAEATTTVEEDKTPPTVTASNSGPLSCSVTSVTVSATPTSGVSYVWTVPNGVTNPGNVASFSTTKEGVYTVVVKNNSNGCTASKNTTVTTDNTVCCLTITNPLPTLKSICAGASVTLTATTNAVSPVEIEWVRFDAEVADPYTATGNGKTSLGAVVPSGGSASISSTNFPAVNGQVKTYYVYACFKNAPSACKGFVKHQINVLKPTVTATGGAISCTNTSVQLTATGSPTAGVTSSYSWTGPGGFTSASQNPTVSVAGNYEVTYSVTKDATTCTVKATATVIGDATKPTVSLNTIKLTCTTTSATLTATTTPASGLTYAWTVPNGVTNPGNVASFTVSVAGTYAVTVTNPANGCTATATTNVTQDATKPTVSLNTIKLTCTTTSATLTATTTPASGLTYAWTVPNGVPNPGNVASFTVSVAGTYAVTVTNPANGCTATATTNVTQDIDKPTVSADGGQLTCEKTSISITANGSPASVNYAWTGPGGFTATTKTITASAVGTYTVTVKNPANGCTASDTAIVTQDNNKPTVTATGGQLTCDKTSLSITANGSPATVTYAWTGPGGFTATTKTITASAVGTYTVTVKNPANGCTASDTAIVTQDNNKPTVTATGGQLTCDKTSLSITANGSPATVTYAWTGPGGFTATTKTITASAVGTYTVTVKNPANGCTASDTAIVTQDNNKPTVTATGGQLTCDKTSLSITANGSPATVTYAWTGPGGFTATTKTITASAVGTYTVTVKNPANGCTASDTAIVTQDNNKPTVTATGGQLTCDKTSLSITANGSPATVTYAWTGPGGFTATTKTITASAVGTYTVTVKNLANGCTASDTAIVMQDTNKPTVTATGKQLTCQNTSVSITATGTPSGVTFSWTGPGNFTSNSATITVNTVGIYTVTATNPANGCTASDTAVVTQSTDKPTVSLNDLSFTCLVSSGTLTATGSANVDYTWTVPAGVTNPGNVASFTVTVPGNYMVMVTSKANGCTATATSTVVLDNKKPVIALNDITLTCDNPSQALTATVTPSTGVTYKWTVPQGVTDPGNVASFTVTVAGTYSVTVTNTVNGCQETASKEVKEDQTKPTVTATGGQLTCDKTSLSITANGSPASVTYAWTGPGGFTATTKTITASAVGTYTVTVTNPLNGCTASDTANVTQDNNKPTVTATGGQLTCDKTSLSITANGSPASVTYAWTGPGGFTATTKTITASTVGTYTVTVTNPANGCTASDTAVVTQSTDKPTVSLNEVVITCEQPSATLTATASPANVSYTWTVPAGVTNPGNVASFTVSVAGTYSVTVTNLANSCTATANTTVTGSTVKPTVIATGGLLTCDKTGIGIKATATPAGVTYSWTGPGNFTSSADSINVSTAGVYTVTVTNPLNGCTASDTAKVTQDTNKPKVTATGGQLTCDKTTLSITANGSPATVTYAWTGPGGFTATTKTITASTAGTYTVTVTNPANGCTASDTAVVTQSTDKPTVSLNEVVITCEQPSVTLTATANPANVSYAWTVPAGVINPGNVASFTVSVAGDYTVVVTAQNGCTASATTKVTGSTDKPTVTVSVANQGQLTCEKPTLVIKAAGTPQGVTYLWSGPGGITATTDSITATAPGIYKVVVTNPANGCTARDSVTITQSTDKPVVTLNDVTLTCDKPTATLTATATPSTGITYKWTVPAGATDPGSVASFTVTVPGEYVVMVTSAANGCTATATTQVKLSEEKPDANPNGNISLICQGSTPITTATLDAKPYIGAQWSQVGTLPSVVVFANANDPKTTVSGLSSGTYKLVWKAGDCADTLTIVVPDCNVNCVKPEAGPDVVVCAPATTSDLPDAGTNQIWEVGAPNPALATINPQTGAVAGLTKDGIYSFILKDSNIGSTCSDTVYIFRGIANAPDDQSTCNDTLTLAAVAGGTYSVMVGNPAPATITAAGKISGLSTVGVYKFLLTKGQCTDTVKVEKLNCTKVYDLALDKAISKKVAQLGDTLTYTIRVWNEGEATAHGIEVTDTLNAGVQYLSYTSTVGTYNAGKWKFDSLAVGDTVSLYVKVRVVAQGVWFNTAEITKMTETDEDSTPGNGEDDEDDIDRECFTVPIEVCRGQAYVATVPAKYTNVVWFKDGQQVATGNTYTVSESGQYTFTATGAQCPAQGCCPIMVAVIDCCPVDVCVPVVIKKTRTAVR